jgi:hypothetical protein
VKSIKSYTDAALDQEQVVVFDHQTVAAVEAANRGCG